MSLPPPPSRSVAQSRFGAESVYLTLAGSYLEPKRVRPSKSSFLVEASQAVVAQLPPWYLPEIAWLSADTLRGGSELTNLCRCLDQLWRDSFLPLDSAFAVPLDCQFRTTKRLWDIPAASCFLSAISAAPCSNSSRLLACLSSSFLTLSIVLVKSATRFSEWAI
jgi:hypothetical protein